MVLPCTAVSFQIEPTRSISWTDVRSKPERKKDRILARATLQKCKFNNQTRLIRSVFYKWPWTWDTDRRKTRVTRNKEFIRLDFTISTDRLRNCQRSVFTKQFKKKEKLWNVVTQRLSRQRNWLSFGFKSLTQLPPYLFNPPSFHSRVNHSRYYFVPKLKCLQNWSFLSVTILTADVTWSWLLFWPEVDFSLEKNKKIKK